MIKPIWIYGEVCSGKSTILKAMKESHPNLIAIDSHDVRKASGSWNLDLDGRYHNIRNLAAIANIISKQGFEIAIAAVTPTIHMRQIVSNMVEGVEFVLANYDMGNIKNRQFERYGDNFLGDFEYDN